jgi:hypothetical protein
MAWKYKGKTYRNLEEQVLENQKKTIKNEKDIKAIKELSPIYIENLYGDHDEPALGADQLIALINQGVEVFLKVGSGYLSVDHYHPGGSISFSAINIEEGIFYEYIIYVDKVWEHFEKILPEKI